MLVGSVELGDLLANRWRSPANGRGHRRGLVCVKVHGVFFFFLDRRWRRSHCGRRRRRANKRVNLVHNVRDARRGEVGPGGREKRRRGRRQRFIGALGLRGLQLAGDRLGDQGWVWLGGEAEREDQGLCPGSVVETWVEKLEAAVGELSDRHLPILGALLASLQHHLGANHVVDFFGGRGREGEPVRGQLNPCRVVGGLLVVANANLEDGVAAAGHGSFHLHRNARNYPTIRGSGLRQVQKDGTLSVPPIGLEQGERRRRRRQSRCRCPQPGTRRTRLLPQGAKVKLRGQTRALHPFRTVTSLQEERRGSTQSSQRCVSPVSKSLRPRFREGAEEDAAGASTAAFSNSGSMRCTW